MTDEEKLVSAVDIILERILTPIVYVYAEEVYEFIVFSDTNTSEDVFRLTEEMIYFNLGINVEILDLRDFDENDRAAIASYAHVAYAENEFMQALFQTAINADSERVSELKRLAIKRKNDTGTYYIN